MTDLEKLKDKVYTLWGTTIYDFRLDLLLHNISIHIIDLSEAKNCYYELKFINVNKFFFNKSHTQPRWNYVELTEIEVKLADGIYSVEMLLWSDDRVLTIESQKFEMLCL